MADRQVRLPLPEADRKRLAARLAQVPTRTVVTYNWASKHGQEFLLDLREVQLGGVPAHWIAEELGISAATIDSALGTHARGKRRRRNGAR